MSGDPFGLIGEVIGGEFRIEALAGDADLSVVYRARRFDSAATVAIKCLYLPETIADSLAQALVAAFYSAYRAHHRLAGGNANIVQTITSGEVVSPRTGVAVPYLVREWLEGESLASILAARHDGGDPPWSLKEGLTLLYGAFDAVAFAHRHGEAHLGINPANLFVARGPDESVSIKVLDFGLARMMNDFSPESPSESHSGCGLRLLLAGYAAPEQVDETLGPVGLQSDVYALATVVTEVLSGRKLPAPLEQVLRRALSTAPQTRQANAVELWRDIRGAVAPRSSVRPQPAEREDTALAVASETRPVSSMRAESAPPASARRGREQTDGPPSRPVQPPNEAIDVSSPPPWKIPSLVPPVIPVGSSADPSRRQARRVSLPWRIAIGACSTFVASLIVVVATPRLRSQRLFAAAARAAGTTLSASSASAHSPPPIASSAGGSPETPAPAAQAPVGPATTAPSEKPAPFALDAAKRALDSKKVELAKCRRGKAWGYDRATVTFANDGSVDKVALAPPLAGTPTGECAASTLAATRIAPFEGGAHPVAYKFYVSQGR
jgi:serine/threonine-protein kinase